MSEIDSILSEIERYLVVIPNIREGDITLEYLMHAWSLAETTVRRRMRAVGENPESGFELVLVYDPSVRHTRKVLRKKPSNDDIIANKSE